MIAICIAGFIGMFSETALNIALSDLMASLHLTTGTVQWLTTGYLLTMGVLVPVSGLLMQWFTTRQLFMTSLSFSIVGAVVAALSADFSLLLIGRLLQAVGIGIVLPLLFNIILVIFPVEKRGAAMGTMGLVIMFAPAAGPTMAGLMIQYLSWNYIFWFTIPFLLLSLFIGARYMQNIAAITKPRVDWFSILLSTIGFGGIVFGFSHAGEGKGGWADPIVIASLAFGIIALIVFCLRQTTMKQPMLNLQVFQYPMFVVGLTMVFLCFMIIMSTMLILPMYFQGALAMTAMAAGLTLLPGGIVNGLLAPVTGMLYDKLGPRFLVIPGFAIIAITLWMMTGFSDDTSTVLVIVLHGLLMIGISMVMMPAQTNGLNQLPPHLYPDGTAFINTLQQISGAIATAVAASIISKGMASYLSASTNPAAEAEKASAMALGSQNAFMFAFIVTIAGFVISLFIRRVKAEKSAERQMPMH
ncbi:DHA2 family efflux MFS transporter permease subunit [Paenibacillus nanensis]|uniref:DHA2 family efflux MFS transporter permease subunit n=1 Tax=Paenibacillus nanensis TaxID=393251 RepID=A0A3A1UJC6_9BACL|nr:MDR family MFS transporter [Paenibacillus nanensis]RIX47253.1 DHA2 family efflux MFS transporter permease subunit [Paenibacillus nanensis]